MTGGLIAVLTSLVACDQVGPAAGLLAGGGDEYGTGGCSDPLYPQQWNLTNTGQSGGVPGEDANVKPVWDSGVTGKGTRIAVVDDGLEIRHEDLEPNVVWGDSWDYLYLDNDPTDLPIDDYYYGVDGHGTAVAGVAAAKGRTGKGGCGVAPDASLVGYNFLDWGTTANMIDAATRGMSTNTVENNSWGYSAAGSLQTVDSLWEAAIDQGLSQGRGGKGVVYMFAAGNADGRNDMANYDNISNYYGTFAIGAVQNNGTRSSYSERGANLLVSAPSGEYCDTNATLTTDRMGIYGYNSGSTYYSAGTYDNPNPNYTNCFNGTSSATPVVTGVVALMVAANPQLTWRDIHIILGSSARKNDSSDGGWFNNAAGLHFNPKYGFGVVDAGAAVTLAKAWSSVGGSSTLKTKTGSSSPGLSITDNACPTYQTDTINLASSNITKIEYVDATVKMSAHNKDADLSIELVSPGGTTSVLTETHTTCYDSSGYTTTCSAQLSTASGFRFGSEEYMNEAADGNWTLKICDGTAGNSGSLASWDLKVYGR